MSNIDELKKIMKKAGYSSIDDCVHDGFANRLFANRECKKEMNLLLDLYKDYINAK